MHESELYSSVEITTSRVAHLLRTTILAAIKEADLNLSTEEAFVLFGVGKSPVPLSMKQLAELTVRDPTTLSRQINSLSDKNLVERNISQEDGRQTLVQPTANGEAVMKNLLPVLEKVRATTMRGVTDSDTDALLRALNQMRTNLLAENG